MKDIKEQKVYMKYPRPVVRLQENEKAVNMPYMHFHDGYEIYIMLSGEVDYILTDDTLSLPPQSFLLINPFTIHKKITKTDKCTTFRVNFSEDIIRKHFTPEAADKILSPFKTIPYGKFDMNICKRLYNVSRSLSCNMESVEIAMGIAEILHLLSMSKPMKSTHPHTENFLDNALYTYVANNLDKEITLDTLSANLYISKKTLITNFKKDFGVSPIHFVNKVKMNFAHSMLMYPEFSVERISKYCGFKKLSYFSKVFKNVFGETPTECRRRALKK